MYMPNYVFPLFAFVCFIYTYFNLSFHTFLFSGDLMHRIKQCSKVLSLIIEKNLLLNRNRQRSKKIGTQQLTWKNFKLEKILQTKKILHYEKLLQLHRNLSSSLIIKKTFPQNICTIYTLFPTLN